MLRIFLFAFGLTCTAQLANAAGASVQYAGVNVAGGEFSQNLPGEYGARLHLSRTSDGGLFCN